MPRGHGPCFWQRHWVGLVFWCGLLLPLYAYNLHLTSEKPTNGIGHIRLMKNPLWECLSFQGNSSLEKFHPIHVWYDQYSRDEASDSGKRVESMTISMAERCQRPCTSSLLWLLHLGEDEPSKNRLCRTFQFWNFFFVFKGRALLSKSMLKCSWWLLVERNQSKWPVSRVLLAFAFYLVREPRNCNHIKPSSGSSWPFVVWSFFRIPVWLIMHRSWGTQC